MCPTRRRKAQEESYFERENSRALKALVEKIESQTDTSDAASESANLDSESQEERAE